jgi:hypothetical protein
MPDLILDGAEYSFCEPPLAIYTSNSGELAAFVHRTPIGLHSCTVCVRDEDIYYGHCWEQKYNPDSLFAELKDVQDHIQAIFEAHGTNIRGSIPKKL